MNVEVEVVQETKTTYLVMGVRSLEEGERIALLQFNDRLDSSKAVKYGRARKQEPFVEWSTPVIVRDGEIVRDDN